MKNKDDLGALRVANASIVPWLLRSASTKAPIIVLTELMHALSLNCPSAAGGG